MNVIDVALLTAEWASHNPNLAEHICPYCYGADPSAYNTVYCEPTDRGHRPECAMDQALSMRGFVTQTDRNNARARIGAATADTVPPPSGVRQ